MTDGDRPQRSALLIAVLFAAGACSSLPAFPPPVPPPAVDVEPVGIAYPVGGTFLSEPEPAVEDPRDTIFHSPLLGNPEFWAEVETYIDFWKGPASEWFPRCIEGFQWFGAMVDSALVANGLPRSLRYLPVLESCYLPDAVSPASAVGLWQFMEPTARALGLEVNRLVDERRDPYAATHAAMRFLSDLHRRFDSWALALAAYNGGPTRVARLLRTHAPLHPRSDELYWVIRPHLPRETRSFVAKFYSGMIVAGSPTSHGYQRTGNGRFEFDEVEVPDATSFDVIARAAGTTEEEIARLNPKYVRGVTPPRRNSSVRVPKGSGADFREAYRAIPPEERVTFTEHEIRPGDTLSEIAEKYGVSVTDLQDANPGIRARYLRVGARLVVPVVSGRKR